MLLSLMPLTIEAQETDINSRDLRGKVVYQDNEVVFRQLDEHTWIGNGHLCYNESLYLVEGNDRAILIDAGTVIPGLDKIVAKITTKPVTMMLTHAHGDHAGGVGPFPEVYLNAGDMPLVSNSMRNYKGQIRYLNDGEVIPHLRQRHVLRQGQALRLQWRCFRFDQLAGVYQPVYRDVFSHAY